MKNTFEETLFEILKSKKSLLNKDGKILIERVIDSAYKADRELIELLLDSAEAKKKFFSEIKKHWVFNINDFVMFIQDKHFLNDSYTQYKNKIGLNLDGKFMNERREVSLVWPFKDCVLEGGMSKEDQKRKEIFFNEILAQDEIDKLFAPKVLTNWKRYTKDGEEEVKGLKRNESGTIKENLLIKGNNLLALHTLKDQFRGKVKLIYIDPPYNTESNSIGYNDNFTHSTWLTFMKNRLVVAKDLLSDDGSIYVQLDQNEAHYCKILLDDVFGRNNFRNEIIWGYQGAGQSERQFKKKHDNIFFYSRTENNLFNWESVGEIVGEKQKVKYTGKDENGIFKTYKHKNGKIFKKYFDENQIMPRLDYWTDISVIQSKKERLDLFGQKPEALLKRIILASSNKNDIVVDFHAGTGTTLAVAHKLDRQYIGIEQMDYIQDLPETRLKKIIGGEQGGISKSVNWKGGGNFIYCELMKYNENFVEQIQKAKDTKIILKIWEEMKKKAFFKHNFEMKEFEKSLAEFKNQELKDKKKILFEMLDKNQLYVNYSEINDNKFKVEEEDKQINKKFYG